MALTQDELDIIVSPALDRIAATPVAFATQTTVPALACIRHYTQTRDSLLRSYVWPFSETQAELYRVSTLVLDTMPTAAWSVADVITGITSGVTATILTVTSSTEYVIIYKNGTFTDGETITNGTVEKVYWQGQQVLDGTEAVYWWDGSSASQVNCGTGYPTVTKVDPNHKWTYKYYLPADFIRLVNVFEHWDSDAVDYRWQRNGKYILTDYSTVNISYIQKVTDPTLFDTLFVEVLILRLAMKLINPLAGTASQGFKEELRVELKIAEAKARVISTQENNTTGRDNFNQARNGTGLYGY